MKSAVLVTGGTGVVGRPLVDRLVQAGFQVVVLCRGITGNRSDIQQNVQFLQGDVSLPLLGLETGEYNKLCKAIGRIFHLAARTDFKGQSVADYEDVNINGVLNILKFAMDADAHLHHVSTAFVCGRYQGVFHEDELGCDSGFHNGYEKSKFIAETLLRQKARNSNIRFTVYRPSIILERRPTSESVKAFGPFVFIDAVFRLLASTVNREKSDKPLRVGGNRDCHLPFIFNDDVAKAIYSIAGTQEIEGKTYHLVCEKSFPNIVLEDIFNRAFGRVVATMVAPDKFEEDPLSRVENIIARKTAMYAPYLDLTVNFDRRRLDEVMGKNFCSEVSEEELLEAFSIFLAEKRGEQKSFEDTGVNDQIGLYFEGFLPKIIGRRLLPNLKSLSCVFWIQVDGAESKILVISEGRLESIMDGRSGDFGYSVRPETFLEVVSGRLTPQQGFFDGQILLEGSNVEALKTAVALEEFFREHPFHSSGN